MSDKKELFRDGVGDYYIIDKGTWDFVDRFDHLVSDSNAIDPQLHKALVQCWDSFLGNKKVEL